MKQIQTGRTIYTTQKSTLGKQVFIVAMILLIGATMYEVSQPVEQAQASYSQEVREQSQACFDSMTIVECSEATKELESQAETAKSEAELRKEAINTLFND